LEDVSKPSEARESEKRAIKIFEDRKSSEIFLVSSGSFGRWKGIHSAHGTRGRITLPRGYMLDSFEMYPPL